MKTQQLLPIFLVLGAVLPGCRAKNPMNPSASEPVLVPVVSAPLPKSPLETSARANKSQFAVGEAIEFSIEIKNTSTEAIDLNFTSGQKFDFFATRAGEKEAIWSYGMNKRFIQSLKTVSLEAGKTLDYSTVWQGAAAGKYTISALIKANGGIEAAPFQIVVK